VFGHLLSLGQDVFESHSVVGRSHAKPENDSLVRDFAAANFLGLGLKVIESPFVALQKMGTGARPKRVLD